jgi:hypothetical protein
VSQPQVIGSVLTLGRRVLFGGGPYGSLNFYKRTGEMLPACLELVGPERGLTPFRVVGYTTYKA